MMMETVHTSETSDYLNETTQIFIPEVCNVYICGPENLKSHLTVFPRVGSMTPQVTDNLIGGSYDLVRVCSAYKSIKEMQR
jgi:hypothetical protein